MNFQIGDRVSGYLEEDGLPFLGYITSFIPSKSDQDKDNLKANVRIARTTRYDVCLLNTCHPMPLDEAKHNKQSFLAAVSRVSPILYFKDDKARRDFTENLWNELVRFSNNDE